MDILDQRLGVRLLVAVAGGALCICGEGSLVMEAVQVTAGILKVLDPSFRLGNHHVAVEGASTVGGGGLLDVGSDLGYDGGPEGDVGDEVTIPKDKPSVSVFAKIVAEEVDFEFSCWSRIHDINV